MVERLSPGRFIFNAFNYSLLALIAFICAAPMLHVFFMSISEPGRVSTVSGIMLWPQGELSLNGYSLILRNPNIISGYLNTIFYVAVGTVVSGISTLIAAYVLSRKRLRYRNVMMFIITFTMLFNGGLIPYYLIVRNIGLLNTRWVMIIPSALSVMSIIIMRTSLLTVPDSLEESARMDGAGELRILFQILLPVVTATFVVLLLFYAVGQWNNWFFASIFLKDRELFPLQLILREILLQNQTNGGGGSSAAVQIVSDNLDVYKPLVKYATIMVATAPILMVYPFAQKYFVKGVMIGSIKG